MKELKKGRKAPYKGYLLNVGEYENYKRERETLHNLLSEIESWRTRRE